jgi:hypothetical protein
MKFTRLFRPAAAVLLVLLVLHVAAPVCLKAEMRSCGAAFSACCDVAAALGMVYYLFCVEGYIFCKRFLEK